MFKRYSTLLNLCLLYLTAASPAWAGRYLDMGLHLFQRQDYRNASKYFRAAAKLQDHPATAAFYEARCYQHLGEQEKARSMYLYVIEHFGTSRDAQYAQAALRALSPGSRSDNQSASLESAQVPFMVDHRTSHILVPVNINGTTVMMIFDTGADICFFTRSQWERAKLSGRSTQKIRMRGVGGETGGSVVEVNMEIGGLTRQVAVVIEESGSSDQRLYPLLGQTFFGDLAYRIDFRKRRIYISQSGAAPAALDGKGAAVPYRREGKQIVVTAKVNGRECEMTVDTGASSVVFTEKQMVTFGLNTPINARSAMSSGVGGQRQAYTFYLDKVSLGSVEKRDVAAAVSIYSDLERPLLGQSFLAGTDFSVEPQPQLLRLSER